MKKFLTGLLCLVPLMFFIGIVASCSFLIEYEEDTRYIGIWEDELNPYMAKRQYTAQGDIIYKNGVPIWEERCGRGCWHSFLQPDELYEVLRNDLDKAYRESKEEYIADLSKKIGVDKGVNDVRKD